MNWTQSGCNIEWSSKTSLKPTTTHNSSIRSDEGLTLETSAFQIFHRCLTDFDLFRCERLVTDFKHWIEAPGIAFALLCSCFGVVGLYFWHFGLVWLIETASNEQNLWLIIVDTGTSEEEVERNLEYFQGQKLPCLRTFLQEGGIQTSPEGKGDNNGSSRPTQLLSTSCNTHWS